MTVPEHTPADKLAQIETSVYNGNFASGDDVLALVEIAKAAQGVLMWMEASRSDAVNEQNTLLSALRAARARLEDRDGAA